MHVEIIPARFTHPLRHLVLWPHIEKEEDCVIDIDENPETFHLGTFAHHKLVSIGTLFPQLSPKLKHIRQLRLRAMATDPSFRGQNCGHMLVTYALDLAQSKGFEVLWCDARIGAVGFYQKLGFTEIDEIYDVPKIGPHKFMWKTIAQDH